MYRTEKVIKEDMVITKNSPGGRKIFTGGESQLELPFTVSFMEKGDYRVSITDGQVSINKIG